MLVTCYWLLVAGSKKIPTLTGNQQQATSNKQPAAR
jgi:hypothetical protein